MDEKEIEEGLAEVLASINGKLDDFHRGRNRPINEEPGGYYSGYMAEAAEIIKRLDSRNIVLMERISGPGW